MQIFQQIAPPRRQARASINKEAVWYTWSNDFRSLLKPLGRELRTLKAPVSTHLMRGKEYDDTFSVSISLLQDKGLARELKRFAKCLYDFDVGDRLILFTEILNDDLDGRSLKRLFGLFRDQLVSLSNDPLSAMCQPIKGQKQGKEFPLHSDLYIPVILFNVFQNVTGGSGGASLFLSVSAVVELLGQLRDLPAKTRERLIKNLTSVHRKDLYEESFHLLHGGHEWTDELERGMRRRQLRIKLHSGQGYMVHDRRWLHGRETVNGTLTHKRLHRLIFNNRKAQQSVFRNSRIQK